MGLTISSYLADKYLISSDSIEDSDDFFYNKKTSNSDVLSGEADDVFKQIGFSPEYMSYWKEIVNTEDNIEELDNGDVVFNAFFVQKNRNLVVSYERVLYNFKIVKVNSVVKKLY